MIRSTQNATISNISKQRHAGANLLPQVGIKGESYELVSGLSGAVSEVRDAFNAHSSTTSEFPSNAFNGTFE